jgi:hypothetical protein
MNTIKYLNKTIYQITHKHFNNQRVSKYYRLYHPQYFDVVRDRTEYQKKVKDYKSLPVHTQDPLYYDYKMNDHVGGFPNVIII